VQLPHGGCPFVSVEYMRKRPTQTQRRVEYVPVKPEVAHVARLDGHPLFVPVLGDFLLCDSSLALAGVDKRDIVSLFGQPDGVPASTAAHVENVSRVGEVRFELCNGPRPLQLPV